MIKPGSSHIPALDGLRGVAAIMVVIWHLTGAMVNREGWTELLYSATIWGRTGVDLFFVLSGFLITGILIDNRKSPNLFSVFYIRRVCRIAPPYILLIGAYWLCYIALGESVAFNTDHGFWVQLGGQFTFTWNYLMAFTDGAIARGFAVVWSVCIEEQFYIVFPLILWLTRREQLWKLLLAVGLLSALARAGVHLAFPALWQAPYVVTPLRLDGLCAGGLIAILFRSNTARLLLQPHMNKIRWVALTLSATVPLVISAIKTDLLSQMYIWGHLYLTITFSIALFAVATGYGSFLTIAPLRFAGQISYSVYLFHPLFLSLFFRSQVGAKS